MTKPKLIGVNHVALEVDDVGAALEFYGKIFDFQLRGSYHDDDGVLQMAFIDMGDQFLALCRGRTQESDTNRHFGLVVNDRSMVMALATAAGATISEGRPFNFLDRWGNHVEIVDYRDAQFTKSDAVLRALGIAADKNETAKAEMRKKGIL
ncbi:VOC family protein [Rhizobium sp. P38BS-XIX]|uniref:VOC family protein n=1 Tax=Rhizobium sp. P38BS-XIX TaxID=2726740 RepID=UPI00145795B7|nr:VOC family protein [Rhizobium sp. P38BS-XIX]NLR97256.1 VOC family protein [Rhizobium sp. P38BS-XIX]